MTTIRKASQGDEAYVAKTWVESLVDVGFDWPTANKQVDQLLDDPLTKALIACPPNDRRRILGFVVYAGRTLLYVCVRNQERRKGIATALLREAGLADATKPLLYVYDGPSAKWAKTMRPNAVKVSVMEHLQ